MLANSARQTYFTHRLLSEKHPQISGDVNPCFDRTRLPGLIHRLFCASWKNPSVGLMNRYWIIKRKTDSDWWNGFSKPSPSLDTKATLESDSTSKQKTVPGRKQLRIHVVHVVSPPSQSILHCNCDTEPVWVFFTYILKCYLQVLDQSCAALPSHRPAPLYLYGVSDMVHELFPSDVRELMVPRAISKFSQGSYSRRRTRNAQADILLAIKVAARRWRHQEEVDRTNVARPFIDFPSFWKERKPLWLEVHTWIIVMMIIMIW